MSDRCGGRVQLTVTPATGLAVARRQYDGRAMDPSPGKDERSVFEDQRGCAGARNPRSIREWSGAGRVWSDPGSHRGRLHRCAHRTGPWYFGQAERYYRFYVIQTERPSEAYSEGGHAPQGRGPALDSPIRVDSEPAGKGTEVLLKRFKRGNKEGEKGQSLAEFVLVLPIFLLLVFAIIDFGMGFNAWLTVTNSAREGARLGAVRAPATGSCASTPPSSNITCRVQETASSLDLSKLTVTITNAQGSPGTSVVVRTDYDYTLITPLDNIMGLISGGTIGPTLKFSSTADMRLE